MSNIKLVNFSAPQNTMPADVPQKLRELADDVEAGKVDGIVIAAINNGLYVTMFPCKPQDALILSSILQRRAIDQFFE